MNICTLRIKSECRDFPLDHLDVQVMDELENFRVMISIDEGEPAKASIRLTHLQAVRLFKFLGATLELEG